MKDILQILLLDVPWLFVIWMTVVGASVGSFMNVVVYRLPAGLNLSFPPSRCPKCKAAIRGSDNVPVLSWFKLRGKCRHCSLPIASRYPKVEAFVGVVFFCVSVAGTVAIHQMAILDTASLGIVLARMFQSSAVLCTLICMALIDFDQHALPRSLILFSVLVASSSFLCWEYSDRVLTSRVAWFSIGEIVTNATHVLGGGLVGCIIGRTAMKLLRTSFAAIWMGVCCGLTFGFWATIVVGAAVLLTSLVYRFFIHSVFRAKPITSYFADIMILIALICSCLRLIGQALETPMITIWGLRLAAIVLAILVLFTYGVSRFSINRPA